jgi:predicted DNA-binding transcriptional regulator AlpA
MHVVIHDDRENDLCYIALSPDALKAGAVARSVPATDDVTLDFGFDGRLLGIDVSSASRLLGPDRGVASTDQLVGVKEAASLIGVRPSNFVRDHASRGDFPSPVAELATGRVWLRSAIIAYIESRENVNRRRRNASPPKKRSA